jgi:hypothetical protein
MPFKGPKSASVESEDMNAEKSVEAFAKIAVQMIPENNEQ